MENYLMINGKKILLTEEQTKVLSENSPFERGAKNTIYYCITDDMGVMALKENDHVVDEFRYESANYCKDRELLEQRSFYEIVERNLWRFAMENGGRGAFRIELDVPNYDWSIYCDHRSNFEVGFKTAKVAERAIKEVLEPMLRENHKTSADLFEWRI